MDFLEGEILAFDKPYGWTSFDLIAKIRNTICHTLGIKRLKVGHAGTLDPLATGVMLVCTGRKTKQIDDLQAKTKEYIATLQLGATTPSFDEEQPIDKTYSTEHITEEKVRSVLPLFLGEQWQVSPAFSAVKINGKRAYALARKGREVELPAKLLTIDSIELLHFDAEKMQAEIKVVCSKGTYIRALARDIGEKLACGAYLKALRRTRLGEFGENDIMTIEQFQTKIAS
ncbi:MAG: tRNA pseudouridine(55) synthase TruB [Paludibacteraceae bacterium]|nr:tRNA pseudouridine(55) synthase TruB [Paludibacteraceae bacterium]